MEKYLNTDFLTCLECNSKYINNGDSHKCQCLSPRYENREGIVASIKIIDAKERVCRDSQSADYLKHSKFKVQIAHFLRFLNTVPGTKERLALDLGCGPGPYTKILVERGFNVVAIDFSFESLLLNKNLCADYLDSVYYLQEDINQMKLAPNVFDVIIIPDCLQHLGGRMQRVKLLNNVENSLKPGGYFYLSFFNLNLKNYFNQDIHGEFSEGILYERLAYKNVICDMKDSLKVNNVMAINSSVNPSIDRFISKFKFSTFFSRMISISGNKV